MSFQHAGAAIAIEALDHNLASLDRARLEEIESGLHRPEKLMPHAAQALFWIVAIDELLLSANKGRSYRERRNADEDGRVVDGARLARNAVAHGAVVVQSYQAGMTFPATFPLTFGEVRWSSLDEVFTQWAPMNPPTEAQRSSYERHFVNIQPGIPLRSAQRWLMAAPSRGWTL
jgi:hypothetical protein